MGGFYAILMDWMIWKTAEPQTTKMNKANNQGPTGEDSFSCFDVLGTLPLIVTILLAFSLAIRILCLGAMAVLGLRLCQWGRKTIRTSDKDHESGRTVAVNQ